MKTVAYFLSFIVANVVAIAASTLVLWFKPISWLLENYGWSEFAINLFAFLIGSVGGLQISRVICRKIAKSEVGPIAAWVLVLPFCMLGLGEIVQKDNWMGVVGTAGGLLGVIVFKGMVKEELEKEARQAAFVEGRL